METLIRPVSERLLAMYFSNRNRYLVGRKLSFYNSFHHTFLRPFHMYIKILQQEVLPSAKKQW